ncbi:MAG: ImmA/IrrE family metallo-endopeptidase [Sediminibacterium sp.]
MFCAVGLINEFVQDFKKSTVKKKKALRVPYSKLIKEVVRWAAPFLLYNGIKKYPRLKVSYRKCKSADGYYLPQSQTIEILVNKHIDTNGIVFVCLHEIAHFIQHHTNPDFKNYDRYENKLGYDKNPFEVQANIFASKQLNSCMKHLKSIGYL